MTPDPAHAVTRTWTGAGLPHSWNDPNNWSPVGVPANVDVAVIPGLGPADTVVIYNRAGAPASLNALRLSHGNAAATGAATSTLIIPEGYTFSAGTQYVGDSSFGGGGAPFGRGRVTHAGGTNTASDLILGYQAADTGNYSLSQFPSSLQTQFTYVGFNGVGTFHQSGGTHSNSLLSLGHVAGSTGAYTLSAGRVVTNGPAQVGRFGAGAFAQPGGSLLVTDVLAVGSTGSFSLSNNASLTAHEFRVGDGGVGSLTQTGGSATAVASFSVGHLDGSTGSYSLSAGQFTAGELALGYMSGSTGAASITGGHLSATLALVGRFGRGTVDHSAGTFVVTAPTFGRLTVGYAGVATSTYSLSGSASLSTDGTVVADSADGSFTQSGGSHTVVDALTVGSNRGASGHYTLSGGTLTLANFPTVASTIDVSGGTLLFPYAGTSPAAQLRAALADGRISSSSAAAADPQHRLAIGYADSGSLVTARLTFLGDANLDGLVDADDYVRLDRAFAMALADPGWFNGDFNYDNLVNQQDYLLIDRTFALQSGTLSPDLVSEREARFGPAYVSALLSSVPEPSLSSILCPLSSLLLTRRRRRD